MRHFLKSNYNRESYLPGTDVVLFVRAAGDSTGAILRNWPVKLAKKAQIIDCQVSSMNTLKKIVGKVAKRNPISTLIVSTHADEDVMALSHKHQISSKNAKSFKQVASYLIPKASIVFVGCEAGRGIARECARYILPTQRLSAPSECTTGAKYREVTTSTHTIFVPRFFFNATNYKLGRNFPANHFLFSGDIAYHTHPKTDSIKIAINHSLSQQDPKISLALKMMAQIGKQAKITEYNKEIFAYSFLSGLEVYKKLSAEGDKDRSEVLLSVMVSAVVEASQQSLDDPYPLAEVMDTLKSYKPKHFRIICKAVQDRQDELPEQTLDFF